MMYVNPVHDNHHGLQSRPAEALMIEANKLLQVLSGEARQYE